MRHHLAVIALVALAAIGCGGDPAQPDEAALARLREHFLYDDVVRWVRDRVQQSALQTALAERGFALDGSGRQGEQAVDGFTRGLGAGTSTVPLAGLTAVYDSAGTVSSLTVVALSPPLQEQAEALVKLSRSSTEARSGGPAASMLYLLGAERLAPERLLRTSVRLDKQRTQVYSIMYAVAAE